MLQDPLTEQERARVVSEVKFHLVQQELETNLACKILFVLLDRYQRSGEPCHKELSLHLGDGISRKIKIHLYNSKRDKDTVVITTH